MKYFESSELILSLLISSLYGLACGTLYLEVRCAADFLYRILRMPLILLKYPGKFNFKSISAYLKNREERLGGRVLWEIVDFLYLSAVFISYSIVVYLTLDGDFRWYMAGGAIICFFVPGRLVGRKIAGVVNLVLDGAYLVILLLLSSVIFPLRALMRAILKPIFSWVKFIYFLAVSQLFVRKRLRCVDKIFLYCKKDTKQGF